MILYFRIDKRQKEALLSLYPDIRRFVEKTILVTADKIIIERDLFDIEKELSEYHDRRVLNNYDIHKRKMTQTTKDKISKSLKGKYTGWHHFPETKKLISLGNKGKTISQITKDAISKANKGKKRTEEQRRNIGLAHRGLKYKKRAARSF